MSYFSPTDTFASKVAATNDRYADSSVGNVTGSNAVNVFLGIGIAWTIAAVVHAVKGETFEVEPGALGMSVTIFCCLALMAIVLLVYRRRPSIGGELGGPVMQKKASAMMLVCCWLTYIMISAFTSYCYIPGF